MKTEIFNKWTAALRSGNYKQGKGRLYIEAENSFCCLGVLCEVMDDVVRIVHPAHNEAGYLYEDSFYQGSLIPRISMSMHLDNAPRGLNLREELGLDKSAGAQEISTIQFALINYNDNLGYTFAEIADKLDQFVAEGNLKLVD